MTFEEYFKKLIKEDKMEKIIVKTINDLKGFEYCNFTNKETFESHGITISYPYGSAKVDLEKLIEILNSLGGNYEYYSTKEINTMKDLKLFLIKTNLSLRIMGEETILFEETDSYIYKYINEIEEEYNVKLNILK